MAVASVVERLRRLDDKVLGPPRPDSPARMRHAFLAGLLVLVAVVVVAIVTERPGTLAGVGGALGVMLSTGIRWRRSVRTAR